MGRTLSFVIPALNEAGAIGPTLASLPVPRLRTDGWDVEVLVVDGGSTDGTAAEATSNGARVVVEPAPGYGRAYRTGFQAAKGEILVTGDADGTYPFEAVPQLLQQFEADGLAFLSTNRFAGLERGAMSARNRLGNWILTAATRALFGVRLRDSQSGMWIVRRQIVPLVLPSSDGMPFSEEIKVRAFRLLGARAREVGIPYRARLGKVKLQPVRDGFRNLWFLVRWRFGRSIPPPRRPGPPGSSPSEAHGAP